jgi:hypothetical protein
LAGVARVESPEPVSVSGAIAGAGGIIGAGAKTGGGACSRSMTDFAISAAERI